MNRSPRRIFSGVSGTAGLFSLLLLGYFVPTLDQSAHASSSAPLRLLVLADPSNSVVGSIMKTYMIYSTDMDWGHPIYFPTITSSGGGTSLAQIDTLLHNFPYVNRIAVINYDFEHWNRTPASEQANPVISVNTAASMAHQAGKKFMFVPDGRYLLDLNNGVPWYKQYNWKSIDYVNMQTGEMGKDIPSLVANVQNVAAYIRSQNPSTVIFAQLFFTRDTPQTLIQKTNDLSGILDGITYYYIGSQTACPNCTPANLQTVLHNLRPTL